MAIASDIVPIHPSWLSRWDTRWKIGAFALTTTLTMWLRSDVLLATATAGSAVLLLSGRPDYGWLIRRLTTMLLFLVPFVAYLLLSPREAGRPECIRLATRATLCFLLAATFVATTRFPQAAAALSSLAIPQLLTKLLLLTHRHIWVIRDQWQRIRMALRARGFQFRPTRRSWRSTGLAAATLFLSAEERAKRIAAGMRCRGFSGQFRSLHRPRTRHSDVVKFLFLVSVAAALATIDRMDPWLVTSP